MTNIIQDNVNMKFIFNENKVSELSQLKLF